MMTMIIENDDHGKPAYVSSGKLVIITQDNRQHEIRRQKLKNIMVLEEYNKISTIRSPEKLIIVTT